jgi:Membrane carboxypeptidase (penicillin-binding protein)
MRRALARAARWAGLATLAWVGAYAWADPPTTALIAAERARLGAVAQEWRPLGEIAPDLARAVVAAEDSGFCDHWGVDVAALRTALAEAGRLRGASTSRSRRRRTSSSGPTGAGCGRASNCPSAR